MDKENCYGAWRPILIQSAVGIQDTDYAREYRDDWYGKIPESTVYYPKKLEDQAKRLAADLKIDRVKPAIEPMKFDRLTLILTEG